MIDECFLFRRLMCYNFITFPMSGKDKYIEKARWLKIHLDEMELMLIGRSILRKEAGKSDYSFSV